MTDNGFGDQISDHTLPSGETYPLEKLAVLKKPLGIRCQFFSNRIGKSQPGHRLDPFSVKNEHNILTYLYTRLYFYFKTGYSGYFEKKVEK